jgi:Tfp pilus assembly protein PilO
MMKPMIQALGKLDRRLLWGSMLLLVALMVFEGWIFVLRKPYIEYQKILATRVALSSALKNAPDQSSELGKMANELKQLSDKLSGELHLAASDDKMAASVMEALDKSASAHGLALISIKPGERTPVSVFEEISFEVNAKGAYLQLCQWLLDFGTQLGRNATITEFDMKSADEGRQVALSLKIALYRPLKTSEMPK